MIPKKIHYCWFGKENKPSYVLECIASWKKYLQGYEIIEWNEDNFPADHTFLQNALRQKLWAFVADFVRVKVLKDFGGIYLDADILFIKPLPAFFLSYNAFIGAEDFHTISAGIIGSIKNGSFIQKLYSFYNELDEVKNYEDYIIPQIITREIVKPAEALSKITHYDYITVFPPEYFYPLPLNKKKEHWATYKSEKSVAVHLWAGSWLKQIEANFSHLPEPLEEESWLYKVYKSIEDIDRTIPSAVSFILVDGNQLSSTEIINRYEYIPFLEKEGQYWGEPPDDTTAILEIERQREKGATSIIFAWTAFWWLDYYKEMYNYLKLNYKCILRNERLIGFNLK